MSSDWIEWKGGFTMPVARDTLVDVETRGSSLSRRGVRAGSLRGWAHQGYTSDIVAYRVVGEAEVGMEGQWIDHTGNDCPVLDDTWVEVRTSNGSGFGPRPAGKFDWDRSEATLPIAQYRVVKRYQCTSCNRWKETIDGECVCGGSKKTPIDRALEAQSDIAATLAERGKRYGEFTGHAQITQALKRAMTATAKYDSLADDQKEALEMIAHKIGRILNGDPNYHDSWHDIVGYTKLVADRLEKEAKA